MARARDILVRFNGGFDIVIGNPPYVDYRKIDNYTKEHLYNYKSYNITKTGSLYIYFIELGMRMLKKHAILTFINPYQYLTSDSGKGLRKVLFDYYCIEKLVDVSNIRVFDAASTYTCINIFSKNKGWHDFSVFKPNDLALMENNMNLVHVDNVCAKSEYKVLLSSNPLLQKMEKKVRRLDSLCSVFCGLSASGFRNYVITANVADGTKYIKFYEARDIGRFRLESNKYITKSLYSTKALNAFKSPCIFWARMTGSIRAALSEVNNAAGKVNVLHDFKVNKYILLAIINSKALNYYYCIKNESKHLNGGAFGFDTPSVKELPIPFVPIPQQQPIISLVETILEKKRNGEPTKQEEREIDLLVYRLYGLTYDEVKVIDPEIDITEGEYN